MPSVVVISKSVVNVLVAISVFVVSVAYNGLAAVQPDPPASAQLKVTLASLRVQVAEAYPAPPGGDVDVIVVTGFPVSVTMLAVVTADAGQPLAAQLEPLVTTEPALSWTLNVFALASVPLVCMTTKYRVVTLVGMTCAGLNVAVAVSVRDALPHKPPDPAHNDVPVLSGSRVSPAPQILFPLSL